MLHQHLNRNCPHCGGYLVVLTEEDPMSFNFESKTKIICTKCMREIAEEELNQVSLKEETTTSSTTTSGTTNCPVCGEPLYMNRTTYEKRCPKCGYGYMDYIGDLPDNITDMSKKIFDGILHIPCDNVWGIGKISTENPLSNTLQFDRCERIIFRDKTLDFQFEIPEERYKDIDTIIVNGHKFVRENNETNNP